MQRVITSVRTTLTDLKLAIDGTIIMSENLRDALDNIFDARIPNAWRKISWESATLGFWFTDLLDRNAQFSSWLFEGRPVSYWMTGFFNPQVNRAERCPQQDEGSGHDAVSVEVKHGLLRTEHH
ncbi:Dynein heavy chain 8 axonemal [Fasciola gigantica]|uniref:Dynein heavy chain 8 axonemal n=1 Tax=Fasciola gigantica TaxID=46835 RepID=A0A504YIW0_FASGI|nr:Dynein heavy chain 8 axonemal [Fasciola gigantica]